MDASFGHTTVTPLPASLDLLMLTRHAPERYPFLLQSTAVNRSTGRYDLLFVASDEALILDPSGMLVAPFAKPGTGFLSALDRWWTSERRDADRHDLPFSGGWFLYLGYELAAEIEPSLQLEMGSVLPTAFAVRCRAAMIRDRWLDQCMLVSEPDGIAVEEIEADIAAVSGSTPQYFRDEAGLLGTTEDRETHFLGAVERAKEYIAAGDIYQANLSRGWRADIRPGIDAASVYAKLCAANPGPFAGLVRWKDTSIVSSSPERLLQIRNDRASTRPIAGTRPRSTDADADIGLSAELFTHPKERAEHVMLIDLERNDLGRICEPGSVVVDEMMVLETYAHVHHIVSNVSGRVRDDVTPGAAIRAVFPGGTITGCPKVRCMEIISELEAGPRGAYTGSFGYLNLDGSMDLNILIRTMVMRPDGISLRAGSGIVADSEPRAELEETRAKAKGLLEALRR